MLPLDHPPIPLSTTVEIGSCPSTVGQRLAIPLINNLLVKILMPSNVDESIVCSVRPVGVSANATFIVDIDKVYFSDLKCDDLGTWTATGTKSTFFRFAASGIKISEKKHSQSGVYHVSTQRYFVHGTYNLYHQIIVDIQG